LPRPESWYDERYWRKDGTNKPSTADWEHGGHFYSTANGTHDLGQTAKRWRDLFLSRNLSDGTNTLTVANAKTGYDHSQTTHDYAYITGNDPATDITAAELETLSDGSNADALHVHTVSAITDFPTINYAYVSGNDPATDITAVELETLSDTSNADALHVHTISAITDFPTINYAYVSGNDPATDITGAELETLSDGSNADALHVHTTSGISDWPTTNYTYVSGNDPATDVTGAELETLSDGSDATTLHKHSQLDSTTTVGSDLVFTDDTTDQTLTSNMGKLNIVGADDILITPDSNDFCKITRPTTIGGTPDPADVLHVYNSGSPFASGIVTIGQTIQNSGAAAYGTHFRLVSGSTGTSTIYFGDEANFAESYISYNANLQDLEISAQDKFTVGCNEDLSLRTATGDMLLTLNNTTEKVFKFQSNTTSTTGAKSMFELNRVSTGSGTSGFGTGIRMYQDSTLVGDIFGLEGTAISDGDIVVNVMDGGSAYRVLEVAGGERAIAVSREGTTGLSPSLATANFHSNTSAVGKPVVRAHQDHTSGADSCFDARQDDIDKPFHSYVGTWGEDCTSHLTTANGTGAVVGPQTDGGGDRTFWIWRGMEMVDVNGETVFRALYTCLSGVLEL